MDTVSWLSFFTASGLGAALGVLSLTALGACLYLRAPGQRPAGHPGRGAGLCAGPPVWGRCPAGRTGALLAGVGPDRPVSDRGRAGCPPAGGDHPGPGGALPGERLGDSGVRPGLCGSPAGGGRLRRSGACGKRRERTGGPPGGRDPGGPGCGSAPPGGMALCKFVRAWESPWPVGGSHKKRGGTQR